MSNFKKNKNVNLEVLLMKIIFVEFLISKTGYIVMCIIIQKHYIHCIYFGKKPIKISRAHKAIQQN